MEKTLTQQPSNCIKIVLFGPESTGKTTLSRKLAEHYKTIWIPEFAREYLQNKWDKKAVICEPEDLLPIAKGQMLLENKAAQDANKLLFCDTDLLETKVYGEVYYDNWSNELLSKHALSNTYDLYLLTYIDTPWEADDLRDRPDQREEMFQYFKNTLIKYNRPFIILEGSIEKRMTTAISTINKLLK
ncbi:MAG: ATP-binding protein [Leeuwenhoekiella sp.]